jgi:hypothetical protein
MADPRPAPLEPADSPVVAALRKRICGEELRAEEELLLANATRKPAPGAGAVPHTRIMEMLEERRLRERG